MLPTPPPSLLRMTLVFTWIGLSSLGGGRSAYFYDEVVARRGWLRTDEFLQDFALSQMLPGPNFSNLAVALGYRLCGLPGAAWALVALVGPGAVVMLGLAVLYGHGWLGPGLETPLRWMSAAVVGLVAITAGRMIQTALRGGTAVLLAGLVFVGVGLLRLPAVPVIAGVAGLGLWLNRPRPGEAGA